MVFQTLVKHPMAGTCPAHYLEIYYDEPNDKSVQFWFGLMVGMFEGIDGISFTIDQEKCKT